MLSKFLLFFLVGYSFVGCYNRYAARPFLDNTNLRDDIDWKDMSKTIKACAKLVVEKGLKEFALEFYGECWYNRNQDVAVDGGGVSTKCYQNTGAANVIGYFRITSEPQP